MKRQRPLRFQPALRAALVLAAAAAAAAWPPSAAQAQATDLPITMDLGFETLQLPNHERMGLMGGRVLFDLGQGYWLGPVTYGAASGQRGGFFVGGLELQRRWAIGAGLTLAAGLSLGGGGGAAAPVGNGLMLRPAVALLKGWGPLQAGISWSAVNFPGTPIHSQQAGVLLSWRGHFDHVPLDRIGERLASDRRSGLGFDSFALTASEHRPRNAADGAPTFQLVGARLDRRRDAQGSTWGLEAAAAAQGRAAGYMEILAQASQVWPLSEHLALGVRAAAGLGGGGGVAAAGGLLQRIDGTLALKLQPGWQLGAAIGRSFGGTSALRARRTGLWLTADLEPALLPGVAGRAGTVARTEWGGALLHTAPLLRADGSRQPIDALGLVLKRWTGQHAYLSGQVYSALAGQAGGYSMGLIGGGWSTPPGQPGWQFGAELLAGGAGGGGVRGVSGAVLQGQAWAGHTLADPAQRLRLGLGTAASSSGRTARPLLSLTWSTGFGLVGP